jgi:hypothetical protein
LFLGNLYKRDKVEGTRRSRWRRRRKKRRKRITISRTTTISYCMDA